MLAAQLAQLRADFESLLRVVDAPQLPAPYGRLLSGHFKRAVSPLLHDLAAIEAQVAAGNVAEAWAAFATLEPRAQALFEEALEFLGGVALRELPPAQALADHAQRFIGGLIQEAGVPWSPVVILGRRTADDLPEALAVEEGPEDVLVRLPLPRWDVWYLPLLAHAYGFWIAKCGRSAALEAFVAAREVALAARFDLGAGACDAAEAVLWLPEVSSLATARPWAGDLGAQDDRELLLQRQRLHLWHWIADALGAALVGPAYAEALLFLDLNPTRPWLEGAAATAYGRSRYLPADARRMILVLHVLEALDVGEGNGLYQPELRRIAAIWEGALDLLGTRADYERLKTALRPWCEALFAAGNTDFGVAAAESVRKWQRAQATLGPVLREGSAPSAPPEVAALISAAWSLRARHPAADRIATLTQACEQLARGAAPWGGLLASPPTVSPPLALLHNWLADLETDLARLTALFRPAASPFSADSYRDAVAGRFFRLLSAQDYGLRKEQGFLQRGMAVETLLVQVAERREGEALREAQIEVLDYLGGALIRQRELEGAICALADALLRDFARLTGVNWAARVVPGRHPLFSPATDMVQWHFPDTEIWNLPLMAHEFGHVAALNTPAFLEFLARQALTLAEGHPEAESWTLKQRESYVSQRSAHLHEFFADAFALYCQGPAFAFDMTLLHLNPAEAFLPRGRHPTHAERFEVLLTVLERMNSAAQADAYAAGPYAPAMARLKDLWTQAVAACGVQPDAVATFHRLQARRLARELYEGLEQSYRLGAQFPPEAWQQAYEAAPALLGGTLEGRDKGPRELLTCAWACRVRFPDRAADIARWVRQVWLPGEPVS